MKWTVDKKGRIEIDREAWAAEPVEFDSLDDLDEFIDELTDARNEIAEQREQE